MKQVHLDLQDGFNGDTVSIESGGVEITRQRNVKTRGMIGLAESLVVNVPDDAKTIRISVPDKGIACEVAVPKARTYVGASVANGDIEALVSDDPFYYA